MPFAGESQDPDPCMLFTANIYFLVCALETSVFYNLRSGTMIYNAQSQCSETFRPFMIVFNPSSSDHLCQQLPQGSGHENSH